MAFCLRDERPSRVPTRLEAALARLDRNLRKSVRHNEALESMFTEWQSRWATGATTLCVDSRPSIRN